MCSANGRSNKVNFFPRLVIDCCEAKAKIALSWKGP